MRWIWEGIQQAFLLISQGDPEVLQITLLSFKISGLATLLSLLIGLPLGTILGVWKISDPQVLDFSDQYRYGFTSGGCGFDRFDLSLAQRSVG